MSLVNFRNYESLELDLTPGMVLIEGDTGQGKSNLLEALYILAVAKSPRTNTDRELIRWQSAQEGSYSRVSATVRRDTEPLRVQIDFMGMAAPAGAGEESNRGPEGVSVQKLIRVNGVPRRASELVGQVNAVMFSAQDLELVYGPPAVRRRYLDILISQLDRQYLRALQRYQRVITQRNHLLRAIREAGARLNELDVWDDALVSAGAYLITQRWCTVETLSKLASQIHRELTGDEDLELLYRPGLPITTGGFQGGVDQDLRKAIHAQRQREIAQGVTVSGPHRDDLQLLIGGMDAAPYASRGQSRTAVLAMRLAEAQHLLDQRRHQPILLLDDVLSELDARRRAHVLARVGQYEQCLITATGVESIEPAYLSRMARYAVRRGRIETVSSPASSGTD